MTAVEDGPVTPGLQWQPWPWSAVEVEVEVEDDGHRTSCGGRSSSVTPRRLPTSRTAVRHTGLNATIDPRSASGRRVTSATSCR